MHTSLRNKQKKSHLVVLREERNACLAFTAVLQTQYIVVWKLIDITISIVPLQRTLPRKFKKTITLTSCNQYKCSEAHQSVDHAKKSHIKETFTSLVRKSECTGLRGHVLWCLTMCSDSWWEKKGWCLTEAETPDSQTLREQANCEDVVKDCKKYHSDPEQMADWVCATMGSN